MDKQFIFKCQCGQVHHIDYPEKDGTKVRVQCDVGPVLLWTGKAFMIIQQISEANRQPYRRGHWLHDYAIGGSRYNQRFFWSKQGWPLRFAITLAVRIWRRRVKTFGWTPLRGYWDDSSSHTSVQSEGLPPSEKQIIEKGRREDV